uniref:DDE Tnp4 domain-containing protein n=1 Tax=Lactuca sativa TaxID=4236 RepID=A0A9R1XEP9_LACSA|nr:hypothetical protein LSAT_V11C400161520 [Lactuca sativa]
MAIVSTFLGFKEGSIGYLEALEDCIGAINGTHMKATVPQRDQIKYVGRNNYVTQNIMWAGCEGSAHDTGIFNEAQRRREVKFPLPANG